MRITLYMLDEIKMLFPGAVKLCTNTASNSYQRGCTLRDALAHVFCNRFELFRIDFPDSKIYLNRFYSAFEPIQ